MDEQATPVDARQPPPLSDAVVAATTGATATAAAITAVLVVLRLDGAERVAPLAADAVLLGAAIVLRVAGTERRGALAAVALAVAVALTAAGDDARLAFLPLFTLVLTIALAAPPAWVPPAVLVIALGLVAPALAGTPPPATGWLVAGGVVALPAAVLPLARRVGPAGSGRPAPGADPPGATAPPASATAPPASASASPESPAGRRASVAGVPSPPPVGRASPAAAPPAAAPPWWAAELTDRQLQVLELAATGLRHAEIADRLDISVHQVGYALRRSRELSGLPTTRAVVAAIARSRDAAR